MLQCRIVKLHVYILKICYCGDFTCLHGYVCSISGKNIAKVLTFEGNGEKAWRDIGKLNLKNACVGELNYHFSVSDRNVYGKNLRHELFAN